MIFQETRLIAVGVQGIVEQACDTATPASMALLKHGRLGCAATAWYTNTCKKLFKISLRGEGAAQPLHERLSKRCLIKALESILYGNISAHNTHTNY